MRGKDARAARRRRVRLLAVAERFVSPAVFTRPTPDPPHVIEISSRGLQAGKLLHGARDSYFLLAVGAIPTSDSPHHVISPGELLHGACVYGADARHGVGGEHDDDDDDDEFLDDDDVYDDDEDIRRTDKPGMLMLVEVCCLR